MEKIYFSTPVIPLKGMLGNANIAINSTVIDFNQSLSASDWEDFLSESREENDRFHSLELTFRGTRQTDTQPDFNDIDRLASNVERVQSNTIIVLPTVHQSKAGTVSIADYWASLQLQGITAKTVGIVQGKTYDECVECYNELKSKVDVIGFGFTAFNHDESKDVGPLSLYSQTRNKVIQYIKASGSYDTSKEHALIELYDTDEGDLYRDDTTFKYLFTALPYVTVALARVRDLSSYETELEPETLMHYKTAPDMSDEDLAAIINNQNIIKALFSVD